MTAPTAARPASAVLSDVELRAQLERTKRQAEKDLAQERLAVADAPSFIYAAEWNVKAGVVAETKIRIASVALGVAPERMRAALAYVIGTELNASGTSSDAFTNAVAAARVGAAKSFLRSVYGEVDAAELLSHLV